jgi:hypothetical protein
MKGLENMNKDLLNKFVEKIKFWRQSIGTKPSVKLDLPQFNNPTKKLPYNKILIGVSAGFILGALGGAFILNMKLQKVLKEYENTKLTLSSKLKFCQSLSSQYTQSTPVPSNVLSVINAIPTSDIFASFYAKLIKDQEKNQKGKQEHRQTQHYQSALTSSPPPPPPQLPPLKSLVAGNPPGGNQNGLQWIVPSAPPVPQVSVITCSNNNTNCYAVSSDGTVYTNGYKEGDYKLVVTPSQVYWVKIHKDHSEN